MKVDQTRSDRMEIDPSESGWISKLFAVFFLVSSLLVIGYGIQISGQNTLLLLLLGIIFGLIGSLIGLLKTHLILRQSPTPEIDIYYLLIFPIWKRSIPIRDQNVVLLTAEQKTQRSGGYWCYTVRIGPPPSTEITQSRNREETDSQDPENCVFFIYEYKSYFYARKLAKAIARFFFLPFADCTTPLAQICQPDELDLPYYERVRKKQKEVLLPPQPTEMKSKIEETDENVIIKIPSSSSSWLPLGCLILLGIHLLIIFVLFSIFLAFQTVSVAILICLVGLTLIILFLKKMIRWLSSKEIQLVLSHEGIRYYENEKPRIFFPLNKIEEVFIGNTTPKISEISIRSRSGQKIEFNTQQFPILQALEKLFQPSLIIRSDEQIVEIGKHLSQEEKEYLHAVLTRGLLIYSEDESIF